MRILVTGGAGYVGSLLVPALLKRGHLVTVVDWFLYGETLADHPNLTRKRLDLRDVWALDCDVVIHLACISNDPSFVLDPDMGKAINYDATMKLVRLAQQSSVSLFVYASSSSVYGVKPDGVEVTENLPLEPLTDYSKYKALSEDVVLAANSRELTTTVLRPATICGYSPRQRLDLIVNAMTASGVLTKKVRLEGGMQRRASLHIQDMVAAYLMVLDHPASAARVGGQVFNVGAENARAKELAEKVAVITKATIDTVPQRDDRSYTINSDKIAKVLKFRPKHTVEQAIQELQAALTDGRLPNALDDPKYYNLRQMQAWATSS